MLPELAGEEVPSEITQVVFDPEEGALHLYSQPRTPEYHIEVINGVKTPVHNHDGGKVREPYEDHYRTIFGRATMADVLAFENYRKHRDGF